MVLIYAGISVEIQEVELKNKPEHLLTISPILFRYPTLSFPANGLDYRAIVRIKNASMTPFL